MVSLRVAGVVVLLCAALRPSGAAEYTIPEVKFEALKKGGFRVSIPDIGGTTLLTFNANINEDVSSGNFPKINGDATSPTNGVYLLEFNNQLKPGDTVNYKVFVAVGRLGYRKDNLSWTVTDSDLQDSYAPLGPSCRPGYTISNGQSSCFGALIIADDFENDIDASKWIVEQRIPTYSEVTTELNYYQNSNDVVFTRDQVLYLKPIPADSNDKIRGTLDLRDGCTSTDPNQCFHRHKGAFVIPPVKSARLKSKIPFKYGKIEIKAQLPSGDWIVPIVQLETNEKTPDGFSPKVLIAYSRGNDHLIGTAGDDIGGRTLYVGPVLDVTDPGRSAKLLTKVASNDQRFSNKFHTYTLEWLPGKMTFYLDSQKLGSVDTNTGFSSFHNNWGALEAPFNKECFLSLGVAVGGAGEFPDNYRSGNNPKPWSYDQTNFVNKFFNERNKWLPTWTGDNVALRVDHVKVWAV